MLPASSRFRSVRAKFMNDANALLTAESGQKASAKRSPKPAAAEKGKAISVETHDHNGGDRLVLYRSQQSVHNATESAVQGRKS